VHQLRTDASRRMASRDPRNKVHQNPLSHATHETHNAAKFGRAPTKNVRDIYC